MILCRIICRADVIQLDMFVSFVIEPLFRARPGGSISVITASYSSSLLPLLRKHQRHHGVIQQQPAACAPDAA